MSQQMGQPNQIIIGANEDGAPTAPWAVKATKLLKEEGFFN